MQCFNHEISSTGGTPCKTGEAPGYERLQFTALRQYVVFFVLLNLVLLRLKAMFSFLALLRGLVEFFFQASEANPNLVSKNGFRSF